MAKAKAHDPMSMAASIFTDTKKGLGEVMIGHAQEHQATMAKARAAHKAALQKGVTDFKLSAPTRWDENGYTEVLTTRGNTKEYGMGIYGMGINPKDPSTKEGMQAGLNLDKFTTAYESQAEMYRVHGETYYDAIDKITAAELDPKTHPNMNVEASKELAAKFREGSLAEKDQMSQAGLIVSEQQQWDPMVYIKDNLGILKDMAPERGLPQRVINPDGSETETLVQGRKEEDVKQFLDMPWAFNKEWKENYIQMYVQAGAPYGATEEGAKQYMYEDMVPKLSPVTEYGKKEYAADKDFNYNRYFPKKDNGTYEVDPVDITFTTITDEEGGGQKVDERTITSGHTVRLDGVTAKENVLIKISKNMTTVRGQEIPDRVGESVNVQFESIEYLPVLKVDIPKSHPFWKRNPGLAAKSGSLKAGDVLDNETLSKESPLMKELVASGLIEFDPYVMMNLKYPGAIEMIWDENQFKMIPSNTGSQSVYAPYEDYEGILSAASKGDFTEFEKGLEGVKEDLDKNAGSILGVGSIPYYPGSAPEPEPEKPFNSESTIQDILSSEQF